MEEDVWFRDMGCDFEHRMSSHYNDSLLFNLRIGRGGERYRMTLILFNPLNLTPCVWSTKIWLITNICTHKTCLR